MTAKEQAEEIVKMFYPLADGFNSERDIVWNSYKRNSAKKIAILHVKGIIEVLKILRDNASSKFLTKSTKDIDVEIMNKESILTELKKM